MATDVAGRKQAGSVAGVVERNIAALVKAKEDDECTRNGQERAADVITSFSGSMLFVYLHVVWFSVWIGWNSGVAPLPQFDPYPFGMLTTIVSLEAIFLATFVLITQNRQAKIADRRADLDVQINLLSEHEVTRLLRLTDAIARRLDIDTEDGGELRELERDVKPHEVLQELDAKNGNHQPAK